MQTKRILTEDHVVVMQRKHGKRLLRSSVFLLNDYLKTFKKDDYNRSSVVDTIKGLVSQYKFEYERACKKPTFEPQPSYGDLMTVDEWKETVQSGGFIDYDGNGDLATGKFVSDIEIRPTDITLFNISLPMWATHVMWYNK